jgi:Putative binding domain, N-terminal/Viral BACON domain
MIPPGDQAFAQPRRSSLASPRSPARSVLASSLALVLIFATIGCESKSSTSTGPSPVKCQVSLEAPANTIDPGGGKDAITVSTQPECSWTASSGASWISGLTPASGQGSGRIEFQAAANPAGTMRQGDIAVNDQHVPVQQKPATCRYEVTPTTQTVAAGGGTVTIAVNTLAGCSWQATVEAGWIAITATSGTGSGDVSLRVDPNGGGTRSAAILVAGQTVTLTQSSSTPASPNCVFTLDRSSQAVAAAGAAITVAVGGGAGCSRTATSEAPWITVVAGATGTGNGAVTFNVASNAGAARTGTVTIAGLAFTVTQAAAASPPPPPAPTCLFSIARDNQSIGAGGVNSVSVAVSTSAGCAWTATSNDTWITLLSGANGNGAGVVTFRVAANTSTARTGTLTIAGRTFTVNQASGCAFSINPTKQSIDNDGGAGTPIAVSAGAGCGWTATSNDSWITVTSGATGSGNGTVRFNVASNNGKQRTGTLTIADQKFTVEQDKK